MSFRDRQHFIEKLSKTIPGMQESLAKSSSEHKDFVNHFYDEELERKSENTFDKKKGDSPRWEKGSHFIPGHRAVVKKLGTNYHQHTEKLKSLRTAGKDDEADTHYSNIRGKLME